MRRLQRVEHDANPLGHVDPRRFLTEGEFARALRGDGATALRHRAIRLGLLSTQPAQGGQ